MKFNEDSRVKIPIILHLMRLEYEYLSLKDPKVTWDESTNIFTSIFHQSIKRINPNLSDLAEVEPIFNRIDVIRNENQKLIELRDWLLAMLMNGQVTVKDSS